MAPRSFTISGGEYRLSMPGDRRDDGWSPVPPLELGWVLAAWDRSADDRAELRAVLGEMDPFAIRDAGDGQLLAHTRALLEEGWWTLSTREAVGLSNVAPTDEEVVQGDVVEEKHDLNFTFEYPDGEPAGGYAYRLTDPSGVATSGKLASDGLVEERDVAAGNYLVELKEVEHAAWIEESVDCGTEIHLVARVSGFDDGASARIRLFRQHQELDAQVLDEHTATVTAGQIEHTFTFDYAKNDARAAQQGKLRLIAEVAFEDGAIWGKTQVPVVVQLKTLKEVVFTTRRAGPGGTFDVVVRALGYAPDTNVAIELWRMSALSGPAKVADFTAPILDDVARLPLTFTPSTTADAPPVAGDVIQLDGEYFVMARIEDDVRREMRSPRILCARHTARKRAKR